MRHRHKFNPLSRTASERKALLRSLMRAVIISERIVTTEAKAKALRPWVDKLITWAKKDTNSCRRLSYDLLGDHQLVKKLFTSIGPRYKEINGGYSRVIDLRVRRGDCAKLSIFELTKRIEKSKNASAKKGKAVSGETAEQTALSQTEAVEQNKKGKGFFRKILKKDKTQ